MTVKRQAVSGSAALSAAVLAAWGLGEFGIDVPDMVLVAMGTLFAFAGNLVERYLP